MTIIEFRQLTYIEQEEKVFDRGIYVINYHEGDMMCDVYKLFDFFVRFRYDLKRNDMPVISATMEEENFCVAAKGQFPYSDN